MGSARDDPNQTSLQHPFPCSNTMSNMSQQWSGLNPPQDLASGCFPDFSSTWNSSPASVSHAFNMEYNMVAAWCSRPPSIGEAFTQGILFAQHTGASFQNSGPCFPPPMTPSSAGPGPGCVSCGQPSLVATLHISMGPPSRAPFHPGIPGTNLSGAPCVTTPNMCPPPGFSVMGNPPLPVANTISGFPFAAPPPTSFPFNPEPANATVSQAPPAPLVGVATSTNTASVPLLPSGTRWHSSSSQRLSRRDHQGWRSRSLLEASVAGPGHGSTEPRPATSGAGRCGTHQPPPVPSPAARPQFRPQCPDGAAPQATNFFSGSSNPACSQNPWAVDSAVTQSRPGGPMFPEPDEPQYSYCLSLTVLKCLD